MSTPPGPSAGQPPGQPETHEIRGRTYVVARVDPLDVDGVRTVSVGTIGFLVAFVALLPFYGRLRDTGHTWWLWACLAGVGLGLLCLEYCRRRRAYRVHTLTHEADPHAEPPAAGVRRDDAPTA